MHANRQTRAPLEPDALVDAVLGASRVLVAVAARSLADAGEDVTLTQYRSLIVLASRGPQTWPNWRDSWRSPPNGLPALRTPREEGADSSKGGPA